jgi:hypothetical protein
MRQHSPDDGLTALTDEGHGIMGLSPEQKFALFDAIDNIPALEGAGVGYDGDNMCQELRPSSHSSGLETYVVIEESDAPARPQPSSSPSGSWGPPPPEPPPSRTFLHQYGREFIGTVLSCGGAGLAIAGLGGEVVNAPVTLGGSLVLLAPTVSAALASSAQCGISLGRIVNAFTDPEKNDLIDKDDGFQAVGTVLDVVSLGGTALGALPTLQKLAKLRAEAKLVGGTRQVLRATLRDLSAQEREVFAKEITQVLDDSGGEAVARQGLVRDIRAGKMGNAFSRQVLSQRLQASWAKQLGLAVGGSALTVTGSAVPAWLSSSSGVLNTPSNVPAAGSWAGRSSQKALDYVFHLIQE